MNEIKNFNDLREGLMKTNIYTLYMQLIQKLPNFFGSQPLEILIHKNSCEVTFSTNGQKMLEFLTDELENKLGLHVLYAIRQDNDKTYNVILYSNPVEKEMYIIYATSRQYGLIDSIVAEFFDSMEIMYLQLYNEYRRFQKMDCYTIESQSLGDIIKNFY